MVAATCEGFSGEHKVCQSRKPQSVEGGAFPHLVEPCPEECLTGILMAGHERLGACDPADSQHLVTLSVCFISSRADILVLYLPPLVCRTQGKVTVWMPGHKTRGHGLSCYTYYIFRVLSMSGMLPDIRSWRIKLT